MNALLKPVRTTLHPGVPLKRAPSLVVQAGGAGRDPEGEMSPSSLVVIGRDAGTDTRWAHAFRTSAREHVLDSFSFGLYHNGFAGHRFTASILRVNAPHQDGWQDSAAIHVETLWTSSLRTEREGYWRETFDTGDLALEPDTEYWALLAVTEPNTTFAMEYHLAGDPQYAQCTPGTLIHWQVASDGSHYLYDFERTFAASFIAVWAASRSGNPRAAPH